MTATVLDLSTLKETSMGDDTFVNMMIEMFVVQGQNQLKELSQFCVDGLSHDWVEVAHALKGTAAGIGAEYMRGLCADAQNMSDAAAEDRRQMCEKIDQAYHAVLGEMDQAGYPVPKI